ncbi:MAG: menaquinone biosynthesis protein [Proteobacteria bacterium]|nr:menaquinone biosynthesis protein [Pseudomonadota bacterium]
MLPRVGHIQFLNCLPLYYGLVKNGVLPDIELYKHTPTELSQRLLRGELDISPIPAIEYARHAAELLLLPRLTVSSDGRVLSILLVSKIPAGELHGRPVALANTSATSQVLTRIILNDRYNVVPRYFESPPDLAQMFMEADAGLLIGDDALRTVVRPGKFHVYDLGEEWRLLTAKKMVYAVWAVRRVYARQHPDAVKTVYHAFVLSMEHSLQQIGAIARDVSQWSPFSARFLKNYFTGLRFEFGPDYQEGCLEFLRRAQALGAITAVPKLEFADVA